jgi:hypothetical protein
VVGQRVVGHIAQPCPADADLDVVEAIESGALAIVENGHVQSERAERSDQLAHRVQRRRQRVRCDNPAPHVGRPTHAGQRFEVVHVDPLALGDERNGVFFT